MSTDIEKALESDQAVVTDKGYQYVDNDELADVGADDDKKAAIIAANSEPTVEPDADVANMSDEKLAANMVAAAGQASLIDEPKKASSYGDNPHRRATRK